MTLEGFLVLLTIIGGMLTTIGAVIGHWFNRDKTASEADVAEAEADKIKAETFAFLYEKFTNLAESIHIQAERTIQRIEAMDECRQDIDRLKERASLDSKEKAELQSKISSLEGTVRELMQAKSDMESAIIRKDKEIAELRTEVAKGLSERKSDRQRITSLEGERKSLLAELKTLRDMMDSDSKSSENGKKTLEQDKITQETVETDNDAE